jgi:hypothetical protein
MDTLKKAQFPPGTPDIDKYLTLMHEVKARVGMISSILNSMPVDEEPRINIELGYLQFRKILELIAFGSLVNNEAALSATYDKCAHKYWRPDTLLKDVESINPDFYPEAIVDTLDPRPGIRADWTANTAALTKEEFTQLYQICAKMLHTENPYKPPVDYADYKKSMQVWLSKIIALLDKHYVKFGDGNYLYLVQMSGPNNTISYNVFKRQDLS